MAANVGGEAKLQDVNTSTHLSFEPFDLDAGGGLSVTVRPFVWNDIGVTANTNLPVGPLESWSMRWLDLEDGHPHDENGLQGVIHSISRDHAAADGTVLAVEFRLRAGGRARRIARRSSEVRCVACDSSLGEPSLSPNVSCSCQRSNRG